MSRPFDAVLCDVDGVIRLYDMAQSRRLEQEAGLPLRTVSRIALADELDQPLCRGEITVEQWVEAIAAELGELVPVEQAWALAEAFVRCPFRADAEVVELLRQARARVPVVLVSNASLALEEDLAAMGVAGFEVVNSARVGVAKPDRRIYEIAAERAGVPYERCLFVDDRQENLDAAVALGMSTLLYGKPEDLRKVLAPLLSG